MNQNISSHKSWMIRLPFAILFIVTFIFFAFFGDYILFYQEKLSLFILTKSFLTENIRQPGGFIIWLGKLASSFFIFPIAGAFILSATLTLIACSLSKIISRLSGFNGVSFSVIISALLFYFQTEYRFLYFNLAALLLQLLLFRLTLQNTNKLKWWLTLFVLPFWYFLAGGFATVFSLMLTFFLLINGIKSNGFKIASIWLVNFLTFYISKEFIFFETTRTLLTYPLTDLSTGDQLMPFLCVTSVITLFPFISKVHFQFTEKLKSRQLLATILETLLTIFILASVSVFRFDKRNASYFYVEKLFCEGRYNDVIRWNLEHPPTNALTVFLNNIALSETNSLNELLFNFPQRSDGSTLFLKWEMTGEILRRGGYFYYSTGMINEAHRWAFENMVMKGHTPEGLKMLIKTEIINGNYKTASRYVNLLKKTLFYRKEAQGYERLLFNDKAVDDDKELGTKRRTKLKTDFFTITDDPYINIERVFASDSLNRQVFEYKTAFSMLRKDYQGIADALPKFARYGYSKFPLHVEEAAAALSVFNNGNLPNLGSIQMSSKTAAGWEQFLTVFQKYGNNPQTAEPALRKQFGNTFWYYSFYR